MEIQELLNRVHAIEEGESAISVFSYIAKSLMSNFYIQKGTEKYFFLELEFYYYSTLHQDLRSDGRTPYVYNRICKEAGELLLHSSGVDLCFKNQEESYGGILIRTLLCIKEDGSQSIITGPWDCAYALFNYTSNKTFPNFKVAEKPQNVDLKNCSRYNVVGNKGNEKYCFYNDNYHEGYNWSINGKKLNRLDPTLLTVKADYGVKPWNRQ